MSNPVEIPKAPPQPNIPMPGQNPRMPFLPGTTKVPPMPTPAGRYEPPK